MIPSNLTLAEGLPDLDWFGERQYLLTTFFLLTVLQDANLKNSPLSVDDVSLLSSSLSGSSRRTLL
jgi:hypothetical protein